MSESVFVVALTVGQTNGLADGSSHFTDRRPGPGIRV